MTRIVVDPDHPHRGTPAHRSPDRRRSGHRGLVVGHHVPRDRDDPARAVIPATPGTSPSASVASAPRCMPWRSVRAVENALGIEPPLNARIIRNLIAGTQFVHDHVVHFYHLHALDWVDVSSALSADPQATATLAAVAVGLPGLSSRPLHDRAKTGSRRSSTAASSDRSPTATGAIPPTSCLPRPTCWRSATTWMPWTGNETTSHPCHPGRQEPPPPDLLGRRDGHPDRLEQPGRPQQLQASAATRPIDQRSQLRATGLSPRSGRHRLVLPGVDVDRRRARQLHDLWRLPDRRDQPRTCAWQSLAASRHRAGEGPQPGTARRAHQDRRVRQSLLLPLRGRRRHGAAAVRGRDHTRLHRPQTTLRVPRRRPQILLAEITALRRHRHGGRSAGPHAGRLRIRPPAGPPGRRRGARPAEGQPVGTVFHPREDRRPRDRDSRTGRAQP